MDLVEEIRKITQEWLSESQFLVDIVVSSKKGPRKILVLVDGDQGFGIDDCANLSRHLSKCLDETNLVEDNYLLEVSTPGVDHPLKLKRQYRKNIGRTLKLKVAEKTVEGKLTDVGEEKITLLQETGSGKKKELVPIEVAFTEIEKAFVTVSFK